MRLRTRLCGCGTSQNYIRNTRTLCWSLITAEKPSGHPKFVLRTTLLPLHCQQADQSVTVSDLVAHLIRLTFFLRHASSTQISRLLGFGQMPCMVQHIEHRLEAWLQAQPPPRFPTRFPFRLWIATCWWLKQSHQPFQKGGLIEKHSTVSRWSWVLEHSPAEDLQLRDYPSSSTHD